MINFNSINLAVIIIKNSQIVSSFSSVLGHSTGTENNSGLFHEFWRVNNEKSVKYCGKIRDELWETISKKLSNENSGYTQEDLQKDLKNFEMKYREKAKGR